MKSRAQLGTGTHDHSIGMNSRATQMQNACRGFQAFYAAKTLAASKQQPVYYKIVLQTDQFERKKRFFSLTNVWICMEATSYVHEVY